MSQRDQVAFYLSLTPEQLDRAERMERQAFRLAQSKCDAINKARKQHKRAARDAVRVNIEPKA